MTVNAPSGVKQPPAKPIVHLRNRLAVRSAHTGGQGVTWCGKKLVGEVIASGADEEFTSYGSVILVTRDPDRVSCDHCLAAFERAYHAAFGDGPPEPIATFRLDDPADVARAKALIGPAALAQHFGPGGGGMASFEAALRDDALGGLR